MNGIIQYMAVYFCLSSFVIKFWLFIHVVECSSFPFMTELYSIVCIHYILFTVCHLMDILVLFPFGYYE